MKIELYSTAPPIGLLKGLSPEPFQIELQVVVPHLEHGLPGFGEFLLVELDASRAMVGRVCRYHLAGQLASDRGDAYLGDLARNADPVPDPLKHQMLRYTLKVLVLGQIAIKPGGSQFVFSVGERTFASLGSRVRKPSDAALAFLCNVGLENDPTAVPLGHLVYGTRELPQVPVRFSIQRLKGRRSFIFARAGYGKSNLVKYLMSQLYSSQPDVGLLIIDPEGEYALPDTQGRPGLVNVPALRNRLSLYTNRRVADEWKKFVRGPVHLDFGDFPPQDIVGAFIPAEKQETIFANMLRSAKWEAWRELVELINRDQYSANDADIARILGYKARKDDVSLSAIKNNLAGPIRRLHRKGAAIGKNLIEELRQGRVVIADTSFLGAEDGLAVTGMLLRRIFQHNVRHLTEETNPPIKCLAVLEEAQTILGDRNLDDRDIFVRWVKEGRKYGLGCVLITQQPSSISHQIISQGDNFFVMHLLNGADLQTLKQHNGYFSDDILGFIRSEPIPGNCYFWSAPNQPFVLSARICNFEEVCQKPEPPANPVAATADTSAKKPDAIARAVKHALNTNPKVWLYRVGHFFGQPVRGMIAVSQDYLVAAVLRELDLDQEGVRAQAARKQIQSLLTRHKARAGYSTLAGSSRQVWVLPEKTVSLGPGKQTRGEVIDVFDQL